MQSRNNDNAKGIDVSHWQGRIDWAQVRKSGIAFAFIKATESTSYADPDITRNFEQSKTQGILRGAYHFARPGASDAKAQVNHFADVLMQQHDTGDLPPVLDLEDTGGLSPGDLTAWVNEWIRELESLMQRTPIVYISPSFASSYLTDNLVSVPLWIANWDVAKPGDVKQWQEWSFWQYSKQGSIAGIEGRVDLDVYMDTESALRQKWRTFKSPVSPPKPVNSGNSTTDGGAGAPFHRQSLVYGNTGIHVKDLQMILYQAGLHPGWIDGIFGSDTLHAVRAYQRQQAIAIDGIVGPVTWSHLLSQTIVSRPMTELRARSQQVKDIQYLLSYYGTRPGPVDGIFGRLTESGVKRFQRKAQIAVDGIVGPNTWHSLLDKLPSGK